MEAYEQYVIDVVKRLRKEKSISQRNLAAILDVSASFIGNVEHLTNPAKYNLKHVASIVKYFGVDANIFFEHGEIDYSKAAVLKNRKNLTVLKSFDFPPLPMIRNTIKVRDKNGDSKNQA